MDVSATDRAGEMDRGLAAAWLTSGLTDAVRRRLVALARIETVAMNAVLMNEGEPTQAMAVVLEGRIALRTRVPERGSITILTVEPGDIVGWSALVPPHRATSTAVALADSRLAVFAGAELRDALAKDAALAAEVYPLVLRAVARRLQGTRLQLLDLFTQRWTDP